MNDKFANIFNILINLKNYNISYQYTHNTHEHEKIVKLNRVDSKVYATFICDADKIRQTTVKFYIKNSNNSEDTEINLAELEELRKIIDYINKL